MKIALWKSYGDYGYPRGFNKLTDNLESRIKLANYLENNTVEVEDMLKYSGPNVLENALKYSNSGFIPLKLDRSNQIRYYVYVGSYIGYWCIEDVDTNKLWTIKNRDGSEYIRYYYIKEYNKLEELK